MSEEEDRKRSDAMVTVPPPEGEDDLYNASTTVGQASAELLALVRAAETAEALPSTSKEAADAKLDAMKETAARAAKEAAAHEVVRRSFPPGQRSSVAPEGAASKSTAPKRKAEPEVERAVEIAPAMRADQETVKRPAVREPERRTATPRPEGGLPPVVTILAVFIAAALALAMIVR